MTITRRALLGVAPLALLAGCGGGDPLANDPAPSGSAGAKGTIRVGSARFAESEIIAELFAQVLEADGYTVERKLQIGAREVYLGALKDGSVDLVPEYTGNLLQFWDPETKAATPEEIEAGLKEKAPSGTRVAAVSPAEDKDAWCVTKEFSEANGVTSLADLSKVTAKLRLAGNPELAERPYGPKGLTEHYGVPADQMTFTPIDDGGGPLTVKALTGGDVDLADIYTTTPAIKAEGLVVLEDPKDMIMAQRVIALATDKVPAGADEKLAAVAKALTTDDLIAMNARSGGDEKAAAAQIAKDWLKEKGLAG